MTKIKRLSEHEAQKIAAGEVIERPVSMVKELIENSIDAQATTIFLHVKKAGKEYICVADNGCGMSSEDAKLSYLHYTTSKINSFDDLCALTTFGFRGEALSSISAISKIELITNENQDNHGIKLEIKKSELVSESIVACQRGTSISVSDLFYNVPVRKKFLKKDETELNQIEHIFQAFCLAHPKIHFKFYSDDKLVHDCPTTNNLHTRVLQLFNQHITTHLIEIPVSTIRNVSISGMISDHQYSRYDRNQIFFFINKRFVKNYILTRALTQGYMNVLPEKKFPVAYLFIDVPAHEIDVNIHPRKEEVQFLHPKIISQFVECTVKSVLEKNAGRHLSKEKFAVDAIFPKAFNFNSFDNRDKFQLGQDYESTENYKKPDSPLNYEQQVTYEQQKVINTLPNIVGQIAATYILIDTSDGVMMVDQHAAHERILYERLSLNSQVETIKLLFPQLIELNSHDFSHLEKYHSLFKLHGIDFEQFGINQIKVTSMPIGLQNFDVGLLISMVLDWSIEYQSTVNINEILLHKMRAQMACKGAVKAGDLLTKENMQNLLKDLLEAPNCLTCPHGRPTTWLLTNFEIEKKFKRKV